MSEICNAKCNDFFLPFIFPKYTSYFITQYINNTNYKIKKNNNKQIGIFYTQFITKIIDTFGEKIIINHY